MSGTASANGAARAPQEVIAESKRQRQQQQSVAADARARLGTSVVYRSDWSLGATTTTTTTPTPWCWYLTKRLILPASANVFVASALPAVAFGVQLAAATNNALTPAHTLLATAAASVVQALVGGQPLLVVGVAEPIVIIWAFLAAFCRGHALAYLPFCAWTCVFASVSLVVAAFCGAANRTVGRFTRFSCETFGTVISLLFAAVGVKGLIGEFGYPAAAAAATDGDQLLRLVNGLWAVVVALGTAATALALVGRARLWRFGWPWFRALLSDYGSLLSVLVWTAASFALGRIESEPGSSTSSSSVPHRLARFELSGLSASALAAAPRMLGSDFPPWAIAASLIPGLGVACLFWFDHTVSSRMAHDAGGHPLTKPTAYDYDLLLCGLTTLFCGLAGLPPTNGVIPQTPILSRSLLLLPVLPKKTTATATKNNNHHRHSQLSVLETRWPNLIQGLLMAALCLPLVPSLLPLVPMSVVSGFFLFLAIEPLRNMQLWRDQVWALMTDKRTRVRRRRRRMAAATDDRRGHDHGGLFSSSSSASKVPLNAIALVTAVQPTWALGVALLALLAGIAGVAFPLPLVLLVPLRAAVLPRVFGGGGGDGDWRRRRRLGGVEALEAIDPIDDGRALLVLEDEVAAAAAAAAAAVTEEEDEDEQDEEGLEDEEGLGSYEEEGGRRQGDDD